MSVNIYLDYAAATPLDAEVLSMMQSYFTDRFYNPSATYLAGRAVHNDVEVARAQVAKELGVRPREIVFTAGGTEANNLAIRGVLELFPNKNIVISSVEHKSVLEPARQFDNSVVSVGADGIIDIEELGKCINSDTVLVSLMLVNNEIGTLQPVAEVAKIVSQIRSQRAKIGNKTPLYLHTDACQAPNYLSVMPHRYQVDLMTLNGGKIYGPKQTGMLYIKTGVNIQPLLLGGGQEWGARSGTENVPGIVGFSQALIKAIAMQPQEAKRVSALQDEFIYKLNAHLKNVAINGSTKHRIANNIHITLPGHDNERLMMELDELGIQCAVGSACSASSDEPSHVLMAIGLSESDAQSSLRFTLGRSNTSADIDAVVRALTQLCSN